MLKFGYIYKTVNLLDGCIYIGQKRSSKFDPNYLGSGIRIGHAVLKHGSKNFKCELLEWADSLDNLNRLEMSYIAYFRNALSIDKIYNIADGGNTAACSDEARKKLSISKTGIKYPFKARPSRRKFPEFVKALCLCGCRKMPKKRYSKYMPGHNPIQCKGGWNKGKKWPEEVKRQMSLSHKGKVISIATRMAASFRLKGKPAWNKGIKGSTRKNNIELKVL